jgi:hypothetical protein
MNFTNTFILKKNRKFSPFRHNHIDPSNSPLAFNCNKNGSEIAIASLNDRLKNKSYFVSTWTNKNNLNVQLGR